MFTNKYQLYIGANNVTKIVEVEKIVERVTKDYTGFTITRSLGYWEGIAEDSVIVTIYTETNDQDKINTLAHDLCSTLGQHCILVDSGVMVGELVS